MDTQGHRQWEPQAFMGPNLSLFSLLYTRILFPTECPMDSNLHIRCKDNSLTAWAAGEVDVSSHAQKVKGRGIGSGSFAPHHRPLPPFIPQFLLHIIACSWKLSSNPSSRKPSRWTLFQFCSVFSNSERHAALLCILSGNYSQAVSHIFVCLHI